MNITKLQLVFNLVNNVKVPVPNVLVQTIQTVFNVTSQAFSMTHLRISVLQPAQVNLKN